MSGKTNKIELTGSLNIQNVSGSSNRIQCEDVNILRISGSDNKVITTGIKSKNFASAELGFKLVSIMGILGNLWKKPFYKSDF